MEVYFLMSMLIHCPCGYYTSYPRLNCSSFLVGIMPTLVDNELTAGTSYVTIDKLTVTCINDRTLKQPVYIENMKSFLSLSTVVLNSRDR